MENLWQKIGSLLWVGSLILLFFNLIISCYISLGIILVIDLVLVAKKEKTISQWYRKFLPKWVDYILTVGLVVLFIWIGNWIAGLYFLQGTIHGHLNGNW